MYLGRKTKTHQQIKADLAARRLAKSCVEIAEMSDKECEEFDEKFGYEVHNGTIYFYFGGHDRISDDLKARNILK